MYLGVVRSRVGVRQVDPDEVVSVHQILPTSAGSRITEVVVAHGVSIIVHGVDGDAGQVSLVAAVVAVGIAAARAAAAHVDVGTRDYRGGGGCDRRARVRRIGNLVKIGDISGLRFVARGGEVKRMGDRVDRNGVGVGATLTQLDSGPAVLGREVGIICRVVDYRGGCRTAAQCVGNSPFKYSKTLRRGVVLRGRLGYKIEVVGRVKHDAIWIAVLVSSGGVRIIRGIILEKLGAGDRRRPGIVLPLKIVGGGVVVAMVIGFPELFLRRHAASLPIPSAMEATGSTPAPHPVTGYPRDSRFSAGSLPRKHGRRQPAPIKAILDREKAIDTRLFFVTAA